jgi:pSer/pThr/pTyr-binding forkhead associated (FHA) protein
VEPVTLESLPESLDLQGLAHRLAAGHRNLVWIARRPTSTASRGNRISLGRALSADIILRHSSISKFHAYLGEEDGTWHLVDAGSKNGITLNGARLEPRRREALAIGDQISFGSIEALFLDATTLWRVLRTEP